MVFWETFFLLWIMSIISPKELKKFCIQIKSTKIFLIKSPNFFFLYTKMKRSHFLAHWTSDFFCRTNWWYRSWQDHPPRLPEAKAQVKDPLPPPPTTSFSVHIVYICVCDVSFLLFSPPQALQFLDLLNFISHTTPKNDDSWYCEYYTTAMATFSTILVL